MCFDRQHASFHKIIQETVRLQSHIDIIIGSFCANDTDRNKEIYNEIEDEQVKLFPMNLSYLLHQGIKQKNDLKDISLV